MSLKDVSQVGHLSLIETAKSAARVELPTDLEPTDKISVKDSRDIADDIATAQIAASANRSQVVQALANAVRQGTYKPDPQRIAQEILADAEIIARLETILSR